MTGVVIFTEIAIAGCAFLIYFAYALWRDSKDNNARARVGISRIPPRSHARKLLHFHEPEYLVVREKERKI